MHTDEREAGTKPQRSLTQEKATGHVWKVQQVELCATCRRDKIVAKFVLHEKKSTYSYGERGRLAMALFA